MRSPISGLKHSFGGAKVKFVALTDHSGSGRSAAVPGEPQFEKQDAATADALVDTAFQVAATPLANFPTLGFGLASCRARRARGGTDITRRQASTAEDEGSSHVSSMVLSQTEDVTAEAPEAQAEAERECIQMLCALRCAALAIAEHRGLEGRTIPLDVVMKEIQSHSRWGTRPW